MTAYIATIRHHEIARARVIKVEGTLTQAKRAATREFGEERNEFLIVIAQDDGRGEIVASRRVGEGRWVDVQ